MRGAYREPFDNWQAALEAPPERLRADLALLPEVAERGLARAAKDISQGGIPGTAAMLAESSGVAIDIDLDAIELPAGVALERWLKTFPSFGFLLSVAPANLARRDAFDLFRARAASHAASSATSKRERSPLSSDGRSAVLRDFGASGSWGSPARRERSGMKPPAPHRHADPFHHSARRRRACDAPRRGPRRPRRPRSYCMPRTPRASGFFRKRPLCRRSRIPRRARVGRDIRDDRAAR